jgi:DNA polymerase elongation subunit (family B)
MESKRARLQHTLRLNVLTLEDRYTPQNENYITLFGREQNGTVHAINVTNCPITVCVAIGEDFIGEVDDLGSRLNRYLVKHPPQCRKLGCVCGGDGYGVYREPCKEDRKRLPSAVVHSEVIRMRGIELYETRIRSFAQFTLNRSLFVNSAARFLASSDVGWVDAIHRGVFDKKKTGVDAFILTKCMSSFDWIEVPQGATTVDFNDVVVLPGIIDAAPFTVFHFDIETIDKKYKRAGNERADFPVGIISCAQGETKRSFMLRIPGFQDDPDEETSFFDDERDLLMAFHTHVLHMDPDFFAGFNINKFDWPYLLTRAERLGLERFKYLSRVANEPMVFRRTMSSRKGIGGTSKCTIDCPGRVCLDLYPMVCKTYKWKDYTLGTAAHELLGAAKDDVKYTAIFDHFHDRGGKRAILLNYCQKDVTLSAGIDRKMDAVRKLIAKCRIMRIRAQEALDRGNSYTLSMMLRAEMKDEYLMASS